MKHMDNVNLLDFLTFLSQHLKKFQKFEIVENKKYFLIDFPELFSRFDDHFINGIRIIDFQTDESYAVFKLDRNPPLLKIPFYEGQTFCFINKDVDLILENWIISNE